MKQHLPLFLLALLTVVSSLSATTTTGYPIGTPDQPAVALEYCTFLSDSASVQADETVVDDFLGADITSIIYAGTVGHYQFSVDTTAFDQIISTVPSQQAQEAFNAWRENPTVKELLSYLNDKIRIQLKLSFPSQPSPWSHTSYETDWETIANTYPLSTVLPQINALVPNYWSGSSYSFLNERGTVVASVTRSQLLTMERSFPSYETMTNYHRPLLVEKDGVPLP